MKHVALGRSGISTCNAPLGAMYLGTKQSADESFALLDAYAAAGGDFIDTANIYAHWAGEQWKGGESETLLGGWMTKRGNRNRLIIATKAGFNYQDVPVSLLPRIIRQECEKSLKRLGTDVIDLYFAHCDDVSVPQADVLETFAGLAKAGKIRAIGASNFPVHRLAVANEVARANGLMRYEVLQQRHTYLQPRSDADTGRQIVLTRDMENYCSTAGLSIMAYSATLGGAYSGRADRPIPAGYRSAANVARMNAVMALARQLDATPQQVVLAWLWSKPHMLALIAASSEAQLSENLAAADLALNSEQVMALEVAGDQSMI